MTITSHVNRIVFTPVSRPRCGRSTSGRCIIGRAVSEIPGLLFFRRFAGRDVHTRGTGGIATCTWGDEDVLDIVEADTASGVADQGDDPEA